MKRVFIYNNRLKKTMYIRERVVDLLKANNCKVTKNSPEVILVIGGDGTMLSAIRSLLKLKVPFLGINTGNLGFLPGILPNEVGSLPSILLNNRYTVEKYPLLHLHAKTIDDEEISNFAFNEVVIKQSLARMLEAHVFINDKPFNYFTGDGIIFSTPIGTTGYSIWAGGSAIHPDLNVFEITPLQPNDNRVNRPFKHSMIVPGDTRISMKLIKANSRGVNMACDGLIVNKSYIKSARINLSNETVSIIRPGSSDYFDLYRDKIVDKRINKFLGKNVNVQD